MALTTERIRELWENYSPTKGIESFARSVEAEARRDALEEAAKEFDRRALHVDGGVVEGWYEPGEPAEIIRKLKEDIQ